MGGNSGTADELRRQLETAQAIAHMGSWHWDLATGGVTWTDELYRIYGLEPGARPITFEFFLSSLLPEDRTQIQREIERAVQHKGRFAYRERIVRPSGEIRTLDTIGEVLTSADGAVTGLLGTCRDVTDEAVRDARIQFYGDVFANVQIGLTAWRVDDTQLRLVAFNAAAEALASTPLAGRLGESLATVFPDAPADLLEQGATLGHGDPVRRFGPFRVTGRPDVMFVSAMLFPLPAKHVGLALEDVTVINTAQAIALGERHALEALAKREGLSKVLEIIIETIEGVAKGTIGSILLLDDAGLHIRHGAAPRLPEAFTKAIDGSAIGPRAGSCGTAAFRRQPVFVEDIETDPLWESWRELAHRHGLRACWSWPIVDDQNRVLGTFALYHHEPRLPDAAAKTTLERAAHVTRIVLERTALDAQLTALAARIEAAREDERTRIARDIHDQLGQALTGVKLDIGWLARRITDPTLAAKLTEMASATDDLIASVRRISADLRPGILDDLGLRAAIEWQAEEFQKHSGIPTRFRSNLGDVHLDRELATTLFRILQESLTNIARHASATGVDLALVIEHGQVKLEIADDGIGIPEIGPRRSTLGILGMGERARRLGGECTVKRRPPHGTVVAVAVPLRFASAINR